MRTVLLGLLLASCGPRVYSVGQHVWQISGCRSPGVCYSKARTLCPDGFTVIEHTVRTQAVVMVTPRMGRPVNHDELIVHCEEPELSEPSSGQPGVTITRMPSE